MTRTDREQSERRAVLRLIGSVSAGTIFLGALAGCFERRCEPLSHSASITSSSPPKAVCTDGAALINGGWRAFGAIPVSGVATSIAAVGDDIIVGTSDGLWRRPFDGSSEWRRSGLEGRHIRTLLSAGELPAFVAAGAGPVDSKSEPGTFHRSVNGGLDWCTGETEFADMYFGSAIPMLDLARHPGPDAEGIGVLYAGMSGSSIVRSINGGAEWEFVSGTMENYAGDCLIHVGDLDGARLFQGCEVPLDYAWVEARDLSGGLPGPRRRLLDVEELSNRRPNSFASTADRPGVVYIGVEGGFLRLDTQSWRWIYKTEIQSSVGPYTYIKAIWIDPCNPDHIVFGGMQKGTVSMFGLYETFDDGLSYEVVASPTEAIPEIEAGTAAGPGGRDLALLVRFGEKSDPDTAFHVFVRVHE